MTVPADRYEPDDTRGEAQPIVCGESQSHTIAPRGDVDWLRFDLDEPSAILATTFENSVSTTMTLLDGEGSSLDVDSSSAPADFSRINRFCGRDALGPGTYFLQLAGRFSSSSGNAGVRLSCTPCVVANPSATPTPTPTGTPTPVPPDAFEDDDTLDAAGEIRCGEIQERSLSPTGDVDWVRFRLDEQAGVTIGERFRRILLAVRDASDAPVASGFGPIVRSCEGSPLPAGDYSIRMHRPFEPAFEYDLFLTCHSCDGQAR